MAKIRDKADQKKDLNAYLKNMSAVMSLYTKEKIDGAIPLTLAEMNQIYQQHAVASRVIVDMAGSISALYLEVDEARAEATIARKILRKLEDGVSSVRDARSAGKLIRMQDRTTANKSGPS
jgi:hypothetical protein